MSIRSSLGLVKRLTYGKLAQIEFESFVEAKVPWKKKVTEYWAVGVSHIVLFYPYKTKDAKVNPEVTPDGYIDVTMLRIQPALVSSRVTKGLIPKLESLSHTLKIQYMGSDIYMTSMDEETMKSWKSYMLRRYKLFKRIIEQYSSVSRSFLEDMVDIKKEIGGMLWFWWFEVDEVV